MELCLSPPHDAHGGESTGHRSDRVVGLADERARLERLVGVVAGGDGRALVVQGPAGSGKTTLVECAIKSATQFCALRVAGVESERDLAYAGLHRLCAPMLDRLDQLPVPQRQALAAAFGLHSGGQVDMLFLGLAVLGLFAYVSADRPLVCAVDDADRLDEPSRRVLALVARRLRSERIAMVFTVAEQMDDLAGLPELVLRPLTDAEARALLASVVPGPLDTPVRDRIVAESRGNPRGADRGDRRHGRAARRGVRSARDTATDRPDHAADAGSVIGRAGADGTVHAGRRRGARGRSDSAAASGCRAGNRSRQCARRGVARSGPRGIAGDVR